MEFTKYHTERKKNDTFYQRHYSDINRHNSKPDVTERNHNFR